MFTYNEKYFKGVTLLRIFDNSLLFGTINLYPKHFKSIVVLQFQNCNTYNVNLIISINSFCIFDEGYNY